MCCVLDHEGTKQYSVRSQLAKLLTSQICQQLMCNAAMCEKQLMPITSPLLEISIARHSVSLKMGVVEVHVLQIS